MSRSAHSSSLDTSELTAAPDTDLTAPASGGANVGDVLVVTHTAAGEILSLQWSQADDCLDCDYLIGQSVSALFGPVAVAPYLTQVQKVLSTQAPVSFQCVVRCGQQPISFEFLLSPLPLSAAVASPTYSNREDIGADTEAATGIVGVGRRIVPQIAQLSEVRMLSRDGTEGSSSYYGLLSKVAANIRRTLDLQTIWEQTVNGLGELLGLDRCLVCDYSKAMQTVTVVAEYCQPHLHPALGKTFDLALKADFLDTLQSLEAVISDFERGPGDQPYTVLTVAPSGNR